MTSPDLSILIPHNNNTIEKDPLLPTLLSIVDQEGVNIELLIQHGGGIAGLWGKLSRPLNLSAKKENVILRVIEEKSSSPEEALAAGVKRATGNWIGFLKPGEQFLPGALMSLKSALEGDSNIDAFLTGSVTTTANPLAIAPAILPTSSYLTSVQPAYPSHSFFCRTSLLRDEIALEPHYQHQMITEWLIRLLQAGKKMVSLPIVTTAVAEKKRGESFAFTKTNWHNSIIEGVAPVASSSYHALSSKISCLT